MQNANTKTNTNANTNTNTNTSKNTKLGAGTQITNWLHVTEAELSQKNEKYKLDTSKFTIFSDIEGHEAPGGGTVPPEVTVTNLKPDITIWDKINNKFHIFELTVPLDVNISQRNIDKSNKYAHFSTDITHITTTVTAFEISSLGNVSSDNKKRLTALHKFCKPGIKLSMFVKNVSCLSIYSSYHIWLCRNDPVFVTPSYLPAPFQSSPEGEP